MQHVLGHVHGPDRHGPSDARPVARRIARVGRGALLLAAAVALLTACGGDDGAPAPAATVEMLDNVFEPETVRIAPGEAVRFHNRGLVPHNAIGVDRSWSTGLSAGDDVAALLDAGEQVTVVFDQPGVYPFLCSLHATADGSSGMIGTVIVGDVEGGAAADLPTGPAPDAIRWTGVVRSVPDVHPTIQNAVDAADPGDLILIGPAPATPENMAADGRAVYREQVDVSTPYITIRGTDRNAVIIDGEHQRPIGINISGADGVVVENLTVRNVTGNGIYWNGVTGYRGSYLTSSNNAIYGIYAFDSTDGLFEHSYASGSKDAGIYIGQCDPCDAVVTDVLVEHNGMAYSGTNASDVYLVSSVWRYNVSGIVPNTLDSQRGPPFGRVSIVGNIIHDNDSRTAPALGMQWAASGNGVLLTGGLDSLVERNRIFGHSRSAVTVGPNLSRNFWMSGGHVIRDNVVGESAYADLVLAGPALPGTCFAGNGPTRTVPAGLESIAGCGSDATAGAFVPTSTPDRGALRLPSRSALAPTLAFIGLVAEAEFGLQPVNDHRDVPYPPDQPQMPGGAAAPVVPAVDVFVTVALDLDAIPLPPAPTDVGSTRSAAVMVADVPLGLGGFSTLYGVLGWLAPFTLLAAWLALVVLDLARREDLSRGARTGWFAAATVLPFVGAPAYLLVGGSTMPRWLRVGITLGGFVIAGVLLGGAAVVGGLL
jgi:plastocyanin